MPHRIFITGGTGYIGGALIPRLLQRGHNVTALARQGSESKLPAGCEALIGNALDGSSYERSLGSYDTFIHLVGVSHPGPSKSKEFVLIDQRSAEEAIRAAARSRIEHFIYLSVGQPAPVMKPYVEVRRHCESLLCATGMNATMMRPWYVLGPGHRWPAALIPFYKLAERIPSMSEGARRLGLVTLQEMAGAVLCAVEEPARGVRIYDVPQIRTLGRRG